MRNDANKFVVVAAAALFAAGCASTPPPEPKQPEPAVTEVKPAEPAPAPAPAAAPAPVATTMSYNVVRGDNLWGIAGKPTIYGNPYQWPLIFKANRDKIRDADLIEPGQLLSIDKNPSQADVAAAVAHAKTRGAWQLGVAEKSDLDYLQGSGTRLSKN